MSVATTTADEAVIDALDTASRRRSYGTCRICGNPTDTGYVVHIEVSSVGRDRGRKHRLGVRGRTFCADCTPGVVAALIAEMERT